MTNGVDQEELPVADSFERFRRPIFVGLSFAATACAVARASGRWDSVDRDVVYFLLVAGALLILERVKRLSFGKDGFTLETLERKIEKVKSEITDVREEVEKVGHTATVSQKAITEGIGGKGRMATATATAQVMEVMEQRQKPSLARQGGTVPSSVDPTDPHKGQFGEAPERNGRRLSAMVNPASGTGNLYEVSLEVRSTDVQKPLEGEVIFYLHPTFFNPIRKVPVEKGVAQLDLLAYGAFTVGAVADGGETRLEFDLAQEPQFPREFRER